MSDKTIIVGVLVLLLGVGAVLFVTGNNTPSVSSRVDQSTSTQSSATASGPLVPLAQCLKDSGAMFYGAFWCPHCKAQEELFGEAIPALPYVECSTPDGNDQTYVCKEKKIKSYPTWIFADGSLLDGEQSLKTLAEKTGCTAYLPDFKDTTSKSSSSPSVI